MTLNDMEKINYITNSFHQYFDLTLNKNLETLNTVNLIIPISEISRTNIDDIINSFEDTEIEKEKEVFCTKVIDGDTIWVKDVIIENGQKILSDEPYKVRFVGIDTPELNQPKYDEAKNFTTEACLHKFIYLNIDNKKEKDNYDRYLAVVIVKNKNLNEILLKMNLAKVTYIPPSEFTSSNWDGEAPETNLIIEQLNVLAPYFNADMTNIVFTPQDDYKTIYRFEVYKGVIYLKLKPFSQHIRMHVLPKGYDCSNSVLFFKDDMLTENNVKITNDYHYYKDRNPINSYYHINEVERNRDNPSIKSDTYDFNDWDNTYCEFSYDISKSTKTFNNVQICAGYEYNKTTPYYSLHYMGIKDNTNIAIEDRCTLIDANYDAIENISNNITQFHYNQNKNLYIPKATRDIKSHYEENIDHIGTNKIGILHRKNIKYINDILYSEENITKNGDNDKHYAIANWVDLSENRGE